MKSKGFSLLETMVAVGVLMVAIMGPLTIAYYGFKATSVAKNNLIAGNLAQEGIELVRNWRGNNYLADIADGTLSDPWLRGLLPPGPPNPPGNCQTSNGCIIGLCTQTDASCTNGIKAGQCTGSGSGGCMPLLFDSASGFYNYSTGVNSIFERRINITEIVPNQEARVTVTVTWTERFGTQSLVVEEHIFNWTPN